MVDDFLLNLAAGLTQTLLEAGARRLNQAALGTNEERALRVALKQGFAALLAEVEDQLPDGDLRSEDESLARTVFADFIRQPVVAENLLALTLAGAPPDLDLLTQCFDRLDFDRDTLPVDFSHCLIAYHRGLTTALVDDASQQESSLFNQVSLGRTLTIQALLQDQQRTLAQVSQAISRIEQAGPQTVYNVVIENATGLAIGDEASVEQAALPTEVQHLLSEILDTLQAMQQAHVRPGGTLPHTVALDSEQLAQFATIFVRLLQAAPGAREIAIGAKAKLETARRQIQQVAEYKETHDLLQQLDQSSIVARDLIYEGDAIISIERLHWRGVESCCAMVQIFRQKLCQYVQEAFFIKDAADWFNELDWAGEQLETALTTKNVALLDEAIQTMRDVVGQQTSRFNDRLMGAIDALQIANLVMTLRGLYHDLLEALRKANERDAPRNMDQLDKILTSFAALAKRLDALRHEHDRWQQIDNDVRPELVLVTVNPSRFKRRWHSVLRRRIVEQCKKTDVTWARELKLAVSELDGALEQESPGAVAVAIHACHGVINRRFIQVDVDLKRLCGVLAAAGDSLDTILDTIR